MNDEMTVPALVQEAAIFTQLIDQMKLTKKPLRCDLNFDLLFELCEGSINPEKWKERLKKTWFVIYKKEILKSVESNDSGDYNGSQKRNIDIIVLPAWKFVTDIRKGKRKFPIIE